jgi:hypothetical protein
MTCPADKIITGWDLGLGGGELASLLPCDPHEILLIQAKETYVGGGGEGISGYAYATIDIWGLDPRVTVACSFYRTPNPNRTTLVSEANISATIAAYPLMRTKQGDVRVGKQLPGAILFLNSGALDNSGVDDGCELETAMQGIRFKFAAIRTDITTHDIVAAIQAKPNVALGCAALADKLIRTMVVSVGPVGKF